MRTIGFLPLCVAILASVGHLTEPACAADLYLGVRTGYSLGMAEGDNFNDLVGTTTGSDENSSPLYGGTLGVAVPLSDVIPWSLRIPSFEIPYWPGRGIHVAGSEDFRFPGWQTLIEAEVLTGRDYRFRTDGYAPTTPVTSDITATSFLGNVRLDIPIQAPMTALFGRLPMLEPLTIYGGGGVGMSWNDVDASDGTGNGGSDDRFSMAYQGMAGFGYAFSDQTHLSIGWRYMDLGSVETNTRNGNNPGKFSADLTAHEITTSLRFHFYHVPFFGVD